MHLSLDLQAFLFGPAAASGRKTKSEGPDNTCASSSYTRANERIGDVERGNKREREREIMNE